MLLWTQTIVQDLVRKTLFPESRVQITTVASQQEYQVPDMVRTLAVYVAGQLIVPASKALLEGRQIQYYAQDGAAFGGANGTVGWQVQTAQTYPVTTELGFPAPDASPWFVGSRPRFYYNGGYIGLVPPPIAPYTLTIDGVLLPGPIANDGQVLSISWSQVKTAAHGVAALALGSDRDAVAMAQAKVEQTQYDDGIKDLRAWKKRYQGTQPRGPKLFTLRSFYVRGNRRHGGGNYD